MTKKRFVADFWCPTTVGSPMLAGVTSVKEQSKEQFLAAIPEHKAKAEKGREYVMKPKSEEGVTASGNPYVYTALCEKAESDDQFVYVATAAVWLADRGITVSTIFEGQGKMQSQVFKSIEAAEFESAAKSICLSPK